jgi:hypothetical protein
LGARSNASSLSSTEEQGDEEPATAPQTGDGIGVAELFCIFYGFLFFCIVVLSSFEALDWGSQAKLPHILSQPVLNVPRPVKALSHQFL